MNIRTISNTSARESRAEVFLFGSCYEYSHQRATGSDMSCLAGSSEPSPYFEPESGSVPQNTFHLTWYRHLFEKRRIRNKFVRLLLTVGVYCDIIK